MKISDMNAVLKVIQLGGLSPAAEVLFITQPALSQIIKKAETELGVTLFNRQPGKKFMVTDEGLQFAATAEQIVALYENYLHTISTKRPPLRIGISSHYGKKIVNAFLNSNLDIMQMNYDFVEIGSSDKRELALMDHSIDLGVFRMPMVNKNLSYRTVYKERLGIWLRRGAPSEVLAYSVPNQKYKVLPFAALDQEPLALPAADRRMTVCIMNILAHNHINPPKVEHFSSMTYLLQMAERGIYSCISRHPTYGYETDRFFLTEPNDDTYDLVIAYLPNSPRMHEIDQIYQILVSYFKTEEA